MAFITYLRSSVKQNPVLRSVGVYTSILFLSKGVSFLLLFIYTNPKFIEPGENGLLNLFASSIVFLMPFLSLGILQSTSTDFYKLKKDEFRNFFTTSLLPPLVILILSVIGFSLCREYFKIKYDFPYYFAILIPVITFLTYIYEQLVLLIRINGELKKFAYAGIAKIILEFGLSVVLVVFFAMHWKGRVIGIFASYIILGIYAFYYFYKKGYLSGRFARNYIRSELIYAIPIIGMQISIFSLNASDKFFLAHFTTTEVVGVYGVACIFASVINLLCLAYLNYLAPFVYEALSEAEPNYKKIKTNFLSYVKAMVISTALVIITVPFVYKYFINSRYYSAVSYFYLIALGYFIWSITAFFHTFLLYYKQ
ncbi:MAG TPA: oligosaccharide flippase family protein, partial [Chitinophagaceae bacterium]|nr:oligosaccharide flippase family protein [Chitinophagaceae bacterium]